MTDIETNAHAVLLPAIADLNLTNTLRDFFSRGGVSILCGETREEYVGRGMTAHRAAHEKREHFTQFTEEIRRLVGPAIVAIDQEPAGILRLHGLVPQIPGVEALHALRSEGISRICRGVAESALGLGVTMFLAPIVDVVSGRNAWLHNRTLGTDPKEVARIAVAFIQGVQAGGVMATAKHFPGHHDIDADPALQMAVVSGGPQELQPGFLPFKEVIRAGVGAVMTGPALVPGVDSLHPSSRSAATIDKLRTEFGFKGLVVSDDIDSPATHRGQSIEDTAVDALVAGSDLLLLAGGDHLPHISQAIAAAVASGRLSQERLTEAANKVRSVLR